MANITGQDSTDQHDNTTVVIKGDDNANTAYVDSDKRLWVANDHFPFPADEQSTVPFVTPLLNSTSKNMNVDGSTTPVNFDYAPSVGTEYLVGLSMFISDVGNMYPSNFGAITALTNGVEVLLKSIGTEYTVACIYDNTDVSLTFSSFGGSVVSGDAWMKSAPGYIGAIHFYTPIVLNYSNSDFIRVKIQDNLASIGVFVAYVEGWRATS